MKLIAFVAGLNRVTNIIAGVTLTCMMLFTVTDVVLRFTGRPILGSYELVSLGAVVVIGFALPYTSWTGAHVNVDIVVSNMGRWGRNATLVATRVLSAALFAAIGYYLIKKGLYMSWTGEVSSTLQIPFYPVAYALAGCCFLQSVILICQIVKIAGEKDE